MTLSLVPRFTTTPVIGGFMDRQPTRKLLSHALRLDIASIAQGSVALLVACTVAYLIQR